jgi:DNA-binding IscR family transcriptional regulator
MISYMKRDSRLSGVLHVLLHMAEHAGPVTSEVLARAMTTNPVVIRRILAGLREHGYVQSEKGHGGGWSLARDLASITLRDIYAALGSPSLLALGNRTESPGCVVEQAVNAALGESFDAAEAFLLARFGEVTLASLSASVRGRLTSHDPTETHHEVRRHHHRGRSGRTAGSARARART